MRDGLYRVGFRTNLGTGSGIILLKEGRLVGGDSGSYYLGTYRVEGSHFTADVEINRHTSGPGVRPIFGIEHAKIRLEGDGAGDEAIMHGTSPDAPQIAFEAVLKRLAD